MSILIYTSIGISVVTNYLLPDKINHLSESYYQLIRLPTIFAKFRFFFLAMFIGPFKISFHKWSNEKRYIVFYDVKFPSFLTTSQLNNNRIQNRLCSSRGGPDWFNVAFRFIFISHERLIEIRQKITRDVMIFNIFVYLLNIKLYYGILVQTR